VAGKLVADVTVLTPCSALAARAQGSLTLGPEEGELAADFWSLGVHLLADTSQGFGIQNRVHAHTPTTLSACLAHGPAPA
jgi:hypothetical protein